MNQSNQIRKTALYCRLSQDDGIEGDSNSIQITQGEPMEQKANITIDKEHITVERTQTACGREIRVISVFPRHGSETVEDKLKALAELDFRQGKLCA